MVVEASSPHDKTKKSSMKTYRLYRDSRSRETAGCQEHCESGSQRKSGMEAECCGLMHLLRVTASGTAIPRRLLIKSEVITKLLSRA